MCGCVCAPAYLPARLTTLTANFLEAPIVSRARHRLTVTCSACCKQRSPYLPCGTHVRTRKRANSARSLTHRHVRAHTDTHYVCAEP